MSSPHRGKWHAAMVEELKALEDNDTFELVPRSCKEVVQGRWVFATKLGVNKEEIYKARFVAKGFAQSQGVNYTETFSPTLKMVSVRILLDLAVNQNLLLHHVDFSNAYLNSIIDHEIYVEQPDGFKVEGKNCEELVLKLNKGLYGLKQSGRLWNELPQFFM